MTQPTDGIQRDADLHGVTPTLPPPPEAPLQRDEFIEAFHFVLLAVAIYLVQPLWTSVAFSALRDSGFYAWYYGPEFVTEALGTKNPAQQAEMTRLQLWAFAAAFPFWLASAAVLIWRLPAAYRRDIGVSLGRWPRRVSALSSFGLDAVVGVAAWLVIAPVVFGVNALLVWLHQHFGVSAAEEHPFTSAAQTGGMRPLEWGLLAFSVAVSAPIWEELFFRGVLIGLCRKLHGGGRHAAMVLALLAAVVIRRQQLWEGIDQGFTPLLLAGLPVIFVLALSPFYILTCWFSRTDDGPIVFGTALLFAAAHSFAWPTPVALFLLGLGLGWLTVWRGSLVAPIVVHSMFNGASYLLLFFG